MVDFKEGLKKIMNGAPYDFSLHQQIHPLDYYFYNNGLRIGISSTITTSIIIGFGFFKLLQPEHHLIPRLMTGCVAIGFLGISEVARQMIIGNKRLKE